MNLKIGNNFEKSFLFERRWRSALAFRAQIARMALEGEKGWREEAIKCLQNSLKEGDDE